MLEVLHRIVQEVNSAANLEAALKVIVTRVKAAIGADVCSVYLTNFEERTHVLMATDGFRQEAVGKVRLPLGRGLVGLVAERAEPVNEADAPADPRYMKVTDTGEREPIRQTGFSLSFLPIGSSISSEADSRFIKTISFRP